MGQRKPVIVSNIYRRPVAGGPKRKALNLTRYHHLDVGPTGRSSPDGARGGREDKASASYRQARDQIIERMSTHSAPHPPKNLKGAARF